MKGKSFCLLVSLLILFSVAVGLAQGTVEEEITAEVAIIDPASSQIIVKIFSGKKDSRGDPHFEWQNVIFKTNQIKATQIHQVFMLMPVYKETGEVARVEKVTHGCIRPAGEKKIDLKLGDTVHWVIDLTTNRFVRSVVEKKEAQGKP